jgi:hypothetical protein
MSKPRKSRRVEESKKKSDIQQGRIRGPNTWSKSTIDFVLPDVGNIQQGRISGPNSWSKSTIDFVLPDVGIPAKETRGGSANIDFVLPDVGIPAKETRGGSANFSEVELKNPVENDKERTRQKDREKMNAMRHLSQFARVIIKDHLEVIWPKIPEILAQMTERFIPTVQHHLLESVTASELTDINIADMYCHSKIVIPITVDTASFSTTHNSLMAISIDSEEYGIQTEVLSSVNWSDTPTDTVIPVLEEDCLKGEVICAGSSFFCAVNIL